MDKLIQTGKCSIIYGNFQGKPNQELFRCPRELDIEEIPKYVNEKRCLLGFEADTDTEDLTAVEGYGGYFRLYFRSRWYGRWMGKDIDDHDCEGVEKIINWLNETFPRGCSWDMEDYLKQFPTWGVENRYLLKPLYSKHYKILFDTTYGNGDYPVRIYLYR